jgi:hypothetical protein
MRDLRFSRAARPRIIARGADAFGFPAELLLVMLNRKYELSPDTAKDAWLFGIGIDRVEQGDQTSLLEPHLGPPGDSNFTMGCEVRGRPVVADPEPAEA